jgi:hypothetical protein
MATIPDSKLWNKEAANLMSERAKILSSAPYPENLGEIEISFSNLQQGVENLSTIVQKIDRDRCIYIFRIKDDAEIKNVRKKFCGAKKSPGLKLPQLNDSESNILYVGSSCATQNRKKTLLTRLRQHILKAPKGTYALSLSEWASGLNGGFIVNAWQYPSMGEGAEGDKAARSMVLAVEDWLAEELKPMFGRRGSRH